MRSSPVRSSRSALASSVSYKASVERDLKRLDKPTARRILEKIERTLTETPDIGEPLRGELSGAYKLRVGDYRVIYMKIPDGVLVLRIGHRKDVYR